MSEDIRSMAQLAKQASRILAVLDTDVKNQACMAMASALMDEQQQILAANQQDLATEQEGEGLPAPLRKRLALDRDKLESTIAGVRDVAGLADPVGVEQYRILLDDGLELTRVSCPIGVLGVVFESRPDVVVQIAALALKSGNAAILKGGSEAMHTNRALMEVITRAVMAVPGVPRGCLQLITTRQEVAALLDCDDSIDLIIPRGSNQFVRHIQERSRIPVLGHADGICHVYLAADAELETAVAVVRDSKCDYPAACNAVETLLVEAGGASRLLPELCRDLIAAGVELRGCDRARELVPQMKAADQQDWDAEYLDLILAVRVVDGVDQALAHIHRHGSGHTEAIVTRDQALAESFLARVDAANVFHNASTRFADGYRFGLGAEVGISTNKTHARGPVGLEGLTIYKYLLRGQGQGAGEYGPGKKSFLHRLKSANPGGGS